MLPFAIHKFVITATRDEYRCHLLQDYPYSSDLTPEKNWDTVKSCIVSAAEEAIGRGKRRQPEWFEDNVGKLKSLTEMKNKAHSRMLSVNCAEARKEIRKQQRMVKKAVDTTRESWIRKVATEGEAAVKDGNTRWGCIRQLQQAYAGQSNEAKCCDGELTQGPTEAWHQHFSKLLNQQSTYKEEVIQQMPVQPMCFVLDEPPTEEESEAQDEEM